MGQLHKQIKHAIDISMGTKKLRELITALAIQGKIVPQVLSEGTASDLINANKDYGVNSKKNSWKKLSRIIPVSPPYQIPASWIWIRLQDVCEVNGGFAFQSSRYVNDGIRVVRISDFDDRGFKNDSIVRYDYSAKLEGYLLNINNIIMAMTGGTVGKSYLVKSIPEKMVVNQRVATIRISKYAIPDYIHFVIKSRLTQGFINSAKNSTNDNISMLDINSFWIPLPPIMEQKRIVEKVDHLMALCDKIDELQLTKDSKLLSAHSASIKSLLESKNADEFSSSWEFIFSNFDVFYSSKENVGELKKAILTLAMKGKLVDQDPNDEPATKIIISTRQELSFHRSDPSRRAVSDNTVTRNHDLYEIPASWVWTTVGEISRHNSGKTLDKARNSGEMRDYITTSNLYWGRFELSQLRQMPIQDKELERCTALKGDLLICEGGEAGRAAVWEKDFGVCFQNHIHRVRLLGGIDPYFVYLYFRKLAYTGEIDSYRKGVGISNMSSKSLASIPVPLPPINEQKRIVKSVEQYLMICDELIEKLDEAVLKQSQVLESIVRQVTAS